VRPGDAASHRRTAKWNTPLPVFRTDSHDFPSHLPTQKKVERTYEDDGKSIFKDAKAEIQTFKLFEERIYLPIAHAVQSLSTYISDLHDVDLDTYILYSFAAVVILIVAAGWFI